MDMNINGYELSSQEELLSENEYISITKELPDGMLNEMGLLIGNDSDDKRFSMVENQLEFKHDILPETKPIIQNAVGDLEASVIQSPTCQFPCSYDWHGDYDFELMVDSSSASKKTWLFSFELKKMFVDVNQGIPLQFKAVNRCHGEKLYVRALAVYNVAEHMHIPVERCPNHLKEDEDRGLGNIYHVLQCRDKNSMYDYDRVSKRFSVLVPLEHPQAGSDATTIMYSMTCKGSCAGGMNRRPVKLIFTLENSNGLVVGRQTLDIRVCSCPKRDKRKEEMEKKEMGGQLYQPDLKRKKVIKPKPSSLELSAKRKKGTISSTCDSAEDTQMYTLQVQGKEHFVEVLKYLIMLKTYEWVKTKSSEDRCAIENYEKMLEAAGGTPF